MRLLPLLSMLLLARAAPNALLLLLLLLPLPLKPARSGVAARVRRTSCWCRRGCWCFCCWCDLAAPPRMAQAPVLDAAMAGGIGACAIGRRVVSGEKFAGRDDQMKGARRSCPFLSSG